MKCFNCGEDVPDGQNFCGNCGAPQTANPGEGPLKPAGGERSGDGSRPWLWVLLGCGGLVLVSCCLALVLLMSVSGRITESAADVLQQMTTIEPDLMDETFTQIATLLPEPTSAATDTPVPTSTPQFSCAELGITTEPWLQVEISCEEVSTQAEATMMDMPSHIHLEFVDYPISPSFHKPQIDLFPVEEYRELSSEASDRIDQLQSLLRRAPERAEQPYPFLPVWNAGQIMAAQYEYLDFQNGQGVRYLTQYGQAAWPINNQDLFYTFQGLTSDGKYYLSAVLPVTHPELPSDGDSFIGEDYESFIDSYTGYLDGVEQELDDAASKSFEPSLSELDAMIETIVVR
jgi:hypothetical protein